MLNAVTREINRDLSQCELTYLPRANIDIDLALQQHQQYRSALSLLGCETLTMPTEAGLADSVFIEDTALVLDELAILCRPGAASRRPEVPAVERFLKDYRKLESIRAPGTLDGGDLLQVGKVIYAGLSTRSNKSGIEQLRSIVGSHGYRVITMETAKCLHLKSAASLIAPNTLLVNPDWISASAFGNCDLVTVDKTEAHAANALLIGTRLIYPSSFPRTAEKLAGLGIKVTSVNVSELQKAEGAVSCCSLVFDPQAIGAP
jgi:dimethylargininase